MQKRTRFIKRNEGFECQNCGNKVPPAVKTCRNHCNKCLFSKHVDGTVPGDRENNCNGLMKPNYAMIDKRREYLVSHLCQNCGESTKNKVANDDNMDLVIALVQAWNLKQI